MLMKIQLSEAGKRFNREWIFRNANLELQSGKSYAIVGPNGSGKSTFLQTIAGMLHLSEGSLQYAISNADTHPGTFIRDEHAYKYISFCAPYLDVIEEMTLDEFFEFHTNFKEFIPGFTSDNVIDVIGLKSSANKQIRYFSSGMKQRVKLAQAIFSATEAVLLDEPCSNFDAKGIELYHSLINSFCKNRLVVVCSNDETEYSFCDEIISITEFKKH